MNLTAGSKKRGALFVDLDDDVQIAVGTILGRLPRLVGQRRLRTSADPFMIAMAWVRALQIVAEERPTGNLNRPDIPDVCNQMGMTMVDILGVIKSEIWIVGWRFPSYSRSAHGIHEVTSSRSHRVACLVTMSW